MGDDNGAESSPRHAWRVVTVRHAHYGGRVHHLRRAVVALLGVAVLATGCSAAGPTSSSSASSSASASASATKALPSGTIAMASLGWKNGPADRVLLPMGAAIDRRVDQANVITAVGRPTDAASVLQTLTETLPAYGWAITASGGGSLVFDDARYDGAFTSDSSAWALTIRLKA